MTIGEKILNMRKARGWSQEDLAERVGVSRQAVSRWEADSAKPDADRIIAICDLFGVSADYLLRDMEVEDRTVTNSPAEQKKAEKPWASWAMTAFGAVTLFILGILASVNRIYMPSTIEQSVDGGYVVISAGHYTGFGYYLQDNGLLWLAWMAALAFLIGGGMLLRLKYREWKKKQQNACLE